MTPSTNYIYKLERITRFIFSKIILQLFIYKKSLLQKRYIKWFTIVICIPYQKKKNVVKKYDIYFFLKTGPGNKIRMNKSQFFFFFLNSINTIETKWARNSLSTQLRELWKKRIIKFLIGKNIELNHNMQLELNKRWLFCWIRFFNFRKKKKFKHLIWCFF